MRLILHDRMVDACFSTKFINKSLSLYLNIILLNFIVTTHAKNITAISRAREFNRPPNVCQSQSCSVIARHIESYIDYNWKPCNNFFDHVCGNAKFQKNNIGLESQWNSYNHYTYMYTELLKKNRYNNRSTAIRKAVDFYYSCIRPYSINENVTDPIVNLVRRAGWWPMIGAFFRIRSLENLHEEYARETGVSSLFTVKYDYPNLYLGKPRLSLEIPQLHPEIMPDMRNPYKITWRRVYSGFVTLVIWLISYKLRLNFEPRYARSFVPFEEHLFKISQNQRSFSHRAMKIRELQAEWDIAILNNEDLRINWLNVIKGRVEGSDLEIDADTIIIVTPTNLVTDLGQLLTRFPLLTIMDFVNWIPVLDLMKYPISVLNDVRTKNIILWDMEMNEIHRGLPLCLTEGLKHATHYLYVKEYHTRKRKNKIKHMRHRILREIEYEITHSSWLDSSLMSNLAHTVRNMKLPIDYPSWYDNTAALDKYYEKLTIGDNLFDNIRAVRKFRGTKGFDNLKRRQEKESYIFELPPHGYNEFYDDRNNSLHIVHGDSTIQMDPRVQSSMNKLRRRVQAFIAQYSVMSDPSTGKNLPYFGQLHMEEIIADNEAIKASLYAYRISKTKGIMVKPMLLPPIILNLTDIELFFYAYENVSCKPTTQFTQAQCTTEMAKTENPKLFYENYYGWNSLRTLVPLKNMKAFRTVFKCSNTTSMNPAGGRTHRVQLI